MRQSLRDQIVNLIRRNGMHQGVLDILNNELVFSEVCYYVFDLDIQYICIWYSDIFYYYFLLFIFYFIFLFLIANIQNTFIIFKTRC